MSSPLFDPEAERQRATQAAELLAAWDAARETIAAQLAELCETVPA